MGIQDREWYREILKERQRKEERSNAPPDIHDWMSRKYKRTSSNLANVHWSLILIFWLFVLSTLFGATHYLRTNRKLAHTATLASGHLSILKNRDGHFYVDGTIRGRPVTFLVDTGASLVTVNKGFADSLGLKGESATFQTANGQMLGAIVSGVDIAAGHFSEQDLKLAVGLNGPQTAQGLLGQNFLSRFDIDIRGNEMILKRKQR